MGYIHVDMDPRLIDWIPDKVYMNARCVYMDTGRVYMDTGWSIWTPVQVYINL